VTHLATPRFDRRTLLAVARKSFDRDFDSSSGLVGKAPHFPPPSLAYAWTLLESASSEDTRQAEAILRRILSSQETLPGAPDFGHFRMLFEDPFIADLNAVQLVLIELIPLAKHLGHRLTPGLLADLRESIRAGLVGLDDIAAHLTYSNVAVLDVANRILGGEYLGDADAVRRGVARLDAFLAYTDRHGGIRDFNSPGYLGQMINTVATLANDTADPATRRKAERIQERLWLQAARHYHPGLAQLAGPYSRAYPVEVAGGTGGMKSILYLYGDDERLLGPGTGVERLSGFAAYQLATHDYYTPSYLLSIAFEKPLPYAVRESADRDYGITLTSYLAERHAVGTASVGFGSQARSLIVHAAGRGAETPKVLYSRFLADGEERDLNVSDPRMTEWGQFAGLQDQNRAIGLYGVRPEYRRIGGLHIDLFLLGAEVADRVWVGDRAVGDRERSPAEAWLVFDLGSTFIGIYPLRPTHLGGDTQHPVSLHRENGTLRLTIENYAGPAKYFWRYSPLPWEHPEDSVGPFFNRNLHAGFLVEAADARDWASPSAFHAALQSARISDQTAGAIRRVRFEREGQALELAIDLKDFRTVERLIDDRPEPEAAGEAPAPEGEEER
jgi:hypothetical protein